VGKIPLTVDNLVIGYDKPLLDPIAFELKEGEKIAILGENGVGKTTFLKTIRGLIPALGGSYTFLPGIVPNVFDQDEAADMSLTPFEWVHQLYPDLYNTQVRQALGNCGVQKEKALRPLSELSGGEVAKTRFAIMSLRKTNFLILDEPTNHLDQKAKDALFEAIERFPGSVLLVSHEKDFYDGLVDYELYFTKEQ
jgi:ATPase subunit of ABC transporter with duplicated ATPase domains